MIYEECKATISTTRRRGTEHLYAHVTGVLIVITCIFIMGPEGGGGGPDPHDPLAGSALDSLHKLSSDLLTLHAGLMYRGS